MKAKKLLTAALAGLMAFGILTTETSAATRAELGAISVSKKGNFKYWEKNSAAKAALISYVKDVTNPKSANFIPIEDRIAVFDVDGTLICETAPYYLERTSCNTPANVNKTKAAIKKAFEAQIAGKGFSLVEVLSPCPTNWNKTPVDALKFMKEQQEQFYPLGEFVDKGGK